jgi:hypothetical protein
MLNSLLNQVNSNKFFKPTEGQLFALYEDIITNVNPFGLSIMSHIVGISNKHSQCYISQTALANKQGYCRKSANRWLKKLHEWGLICKVYRPNKTCLYTLHPIFQHRYMRYLLERAIKSFYFLNISLLLVIGLTESPLVKNPYVYHKSHYQGEMSHEENNRIYNIRYDSTPKEGVSRSGHSPGSSEAHRSGIKPQDPRRGIPMNGQQRIKTLKLTRAGEIKLAAFPQVARDHADTQLRSNKKPVRDLFRFYWSLCKAYCEANKITPEWRTTFSLLAKEGIDNDSMGINPKDPYEYEMVLPKSIDPTAHLSQTSSSDNAPKHSIYHTAQPPKTAAPETREKVEETRSKLQHMAQSGSDPFLSFFASQMADMLKFVKTTDGAQN